MVGDPVTLCFGCRAEAQLPIGPDDALPLHDPMLWETFQCERCGVEDVRLKAVPDD